jgi:hypothetical protein
MAIERAIDRGWYHDRRCRLMACVGFTSLTRKTAWHSRCTIAAMPKLSTGRTGRHQPLPAQPGDNGIATAWLGARGRGLEPAMAPLAF